MIDAVGATFSNQGAHMASPLKEKGVSNLFLLIFV